MSHWSPPCLPVPFFSHFLPIEEALHSILNTTWVDTYRNGWVQLIYFLVEFWHLWNIPLHECCEYWDILLKWGTFNYFMNFHRARSHPEKVYHSWHNSLNYLVSLISVHVFMTFPSSSNQHLSQCQTTAPQSQSNVSSFSLKSTMLQYTSWVLEFITHNLSPLGVLHDVDEY